MRVSVVLSAFVLCAALPNLSVAYDAQKTSDAFYQHNLTQTSTSTRANTPFSRPYEQHVRAGIHQNLKNAEAHIEQGNYVEACRYATLASATVEANGPSYYRPATVPWSRLRDYSKKAEAIRAEYC